MRLGSIAGGRSAEGDIAEGRLAARPAEGGGPENCYAVGAFLIYSSRRYGVEFCDVFARRARPAAVRASRAIQVAF